MSVFWLVDHFKLGPLAVHFKRFLVPAKIPNTAIPNTHEDV